MQDKSLFHLIEIPKIFDDCYLMFAQNPNHIPFPIKRVYYIIQAKTKLARGYHAHRKTKQVIFCIQGAIKLVMDNGNIRKGVFLDQPNIGVFVDKMIWHEMIEFKKSTILLVLASRIFDEKDYIRDYEQFKKKADKIH